MKLADTLWALAIQFGTLSLMAFGGANAVLPEAHRQSVTLHHWMSDQDFAALFAIAQAAPGPNFQVCTLIGWKAAGLAGALVATAAMCAPSCLLTFWIAKLWDRQPEARWRVAALELQALRSPETSRLCCRPRRFSPSSWITRCASLKDTKAIQSYSSVNLR